MRVALTFMRTSTMPSDRSCFSRRRCTGVVEHRQNVRVRADATWNVSEPELTIVINVAGRIVGNDMSSRDIEGEHPLYLPHAKVYDGSCAVEPGILLSQEDFPDDTKIQLQIAKSGQTEFDGEATRSQFKRQPQELAHCLHAVDLGVIPPSDLTLSSGDQTRISNTGQHRDVMFVVTGCIRGRVLPRTTFAGAGLENRACKAHLPCVGRPSIMA
jgi:hypothetical protein